MYVSSVCGGCGVKYPIEYMYRIAIPEMSIASAFVCIKCYEYYIFQYDTCIEV